MNENPFKKPPTSTWRSIQALAKTMLDDPIETIAQQPVEPMTARSGDVERFYQALMTPASLQSPKHDSSLVEDWCAPEVVQDWFTLLKTSIQSLQSVPGSLQAAASEITQPLQQLTDALGDQLEPAPAMRGYSTARMHFPKRSRRIHAADLPVFTPMFCTALAEPIQPVEVNGLQADHEYRCRFRTAQDTAWRHEARLTSDADGCLRIPVSEAFSHLPDGLNTAEIVWFLEEEVTDRIQGENWVSGLVWKQPTLPRDVIAHLAASLGPVEDALTEERIRTLMAINLMIAEQRYQEAYETTRQALLFAPTSAEDDIAPFTEALWQFVDLILQQMTARLRAAEVTFRSVRPAWNAADSLDQIIDKTRLLSSR